MKQSLFLTFLLAALATAVPIASGKLPNLYYLHYPQ